MRKVRTVNALYDYLKSVNCTIGKTTLTKMIRENKIPYIRIADRVLIFDLDEIDNWLSGNI